MLIKNGLIVSPGNQLEQPADLRIRNGIIETIAAANSLTAEPDEQVLDASSLVIAPGLIDIHVHFRDPGLTLQRRSSYRSNGCGSRRLYNCHLHGKHEAGGRYA